MAEKEVDQSRSAQWGRWGKQALLNFSYLGLAIIGCVRGPTLLDLEEIYSTDTNTISYTFLVGSATSIFGSFAIGILTHKLPKLKWTLILVAILMMALSNVTLPFCGEIWLFLAASGSVGFFNGIVHTALNVQCLEIWRGLNPGPYLHSLHFSYSFGAFLAPLLAKPFLGVPASAPVAVNSTLSSNGDEQDTNQILSLDTAREEVPSKIGTLYPITGIVNFAICTGYLYLSCKEIVGYLQRGRGIEANPNEGLKKDRKDQAYFFGNQTAVTQKVIFLVLMVVLLTIYVFSEITIVNYLVAFLVKCDLHLSKSDAANLMAIYLFPYAQCQVKATITSIQIPFPRHQPFSSYNRILAAFFAVKLTPTQIVIFNLALSLAANVTILAFGEQDRTLMAVAYGFLGLGMGSMYANALMWVEQYIPVNDRVAAILNGCGAVGATLSPLFIGTLIDHVPMILVYAQLGATLSTLVLFSAGAIVGREIMRKDTEAKLQTKDEAEEPMNKKE